MADETEILRARAAALARPTEQPVDAGRRLEVLEFTLAPERYAIETVYVREVYPLSALTRVPCTPPFIAGIVTVRGRIVAVLDIRKLFDLPDQGLTDLHRVILVEDQDLELGVLADAAVAVRHIEMETLQPSVETLTGIRSEYLKGVTPERLVVLEVKRILADSRIIVNEEVVP